MGLSKTDSPSKELSLVFIFVGTLNPHLVQLHPNDSCLQNFPLSQKRQRSLSLYLPPDSRSRDLEKLPLFFLLCGWGSHSEKWTAHFSSFGKSLVQLFDEKIRSGELPPFVAAFPDGRTTLGHSQYINSEANGHFGDYILKHCKEAVEDHLGIEFPASRSALAGHSSGGYAALALGLKGPEHFANLCSVAGDGYFELSLWPCLVSCVAELEKVDGDLSAFIDSCLTDADPGSWSSQQYKTLLLLSLSSCFASRVEAGPPLYGDFFFNLETGSIREEVWRKWKDHDPLHLIQKHQSSFQQINYVLLDCGLSDEYAAQIHHRQLAFQFRQMGFQSFDHWEYQGRHSGQIHRFVPRIKKMIEKMPAFDSAPPKRRK